MFHWKPILGTLLVLAALKNLPVVTTTVGKYL